jgi:hypothetical protein
MSLWKNGPQTLPNKLFSKINSHLTYAVEKEAHKYLIALLFLTILPKVYMPSLIVEVENDLNICIYLENKFQF